MIFRIHAYSSIFSRRSMMHRQVQSIWSSGAGGTRRGFATACWCSSEIVLYVVLMVSFASFISILNYHLVTVEHENRQRLMEAQKMQQRESKSFPNNFNSLNDADVENHYEYDRSSDAKEAVRFDRPAEVHVAVTPEDEKLMETQREILAVLSPRLLQFLLEPVAPATRKHQRLTLLEQLQLLAKHAGDEQNGDAVPDLIRTAVEFQKNILVQAQALSLHGDLSNYLPAMGKTANSKRQAMYRSFALENGFEFGNRFGEELFLMESVRTQQCRRAVAVDNIKAMRILSEIPDEIVDLDHIPTDEPDNPDSAESDKDFQSTTVYKNKLMPEDVLIVVATSEVIRNETKDDQLYLETAYKRLSEYAIKHNYRILDEFGHRQLSAQEHLSLLYNTLNVSSYQAIVAISPTAYINNLNARFENSMRLPSHWRSASSMSSSQPENEMPPSSNVDDNLFKQHGAIDDLLTEEEANPVTTADFLPIELVFAVNSWVDTVDFLRSDFLVLRNTQRVKSFLLSAHQILTRLESSAKWGAQPSNADLPRLNNLFGSALNLAYYKAPEICLYSLLLPPQGFVTGGPELSHRKQLLWLRNS